MLGEAGEFFSGLGRSEAGLRRRNSRLAGELSTARHSYLILSGYDPLLPARRNAWFNRHAQSAAREVDSIIRRKKALDLAASLRYGARRRAADVMPIMYRYGRNAARIFDLHGVDTDPLRGPVHV